MNVDSNSKITFPVSLDAFIAHQEELIGESLHCSLREVISEWLPYINGSYDQGIGNESITEDLEQMDRFIAQAQNNPVAVRFLKAAKCWMAKAWEAGRLTTQLGETQKKTARTGETATDSTKRSNTVFSLTENRIECNKRR